MTNRKLSHIDEGEVESEIAPGVWYRGEGARLEAGEITAVSVAERALCFTRTEQG